MNRFDLERIFCLAPDGAPSGAPTTTPPVPGLPPGQTPGQTPLALDPAAPNPLVPDANQLQSQLAQAQNAYKGMQTNYNRLFETAQARDVQLAEAQTQLATLQAQVAQLTQTTETVAAARTQAETLASATAAELEMYRMVTTEYPNLTSIAGTLKPLATAEATREMLKGLSETVQAAVQSALAGKAAAAVPGGNPGHVPASYTLEQLRTLAVQHAGKPEYARYADAYYKQLEASGAQYPRPLPDPFEGIA